MVKFSIGTASTILGAISYGIPGIVLSLANSAGGNVSNIIATQYLISFLFFFVVAEFGKRQPTPFSLREKMIVLASGVPALGINYCFYNSLSYVGIPVATMMLMQSAWISPLISSLINKRRIKPRELISMLFIIIGVLVATGIFSGPVQLNLLGITWGLASALCYSMVILSSSNIAKGTRVADKAKLVTLGGFISSLLLFKDNVDISIFKPDTLWAVGNAIFSAILPIALFAYGMPRTSPAVAGILVTLELPSAYLFSWLILSESITGNQIIGCIIIILAISLASMDKNLLSNLLSSRWQRRK
jgi:drug/metabolite transporter (DMT)-like permease